jgi:hypothetical protein
MKFYKDAVRDVYKNGDHAPRVYDSVVYAYTVTEIRDAKCRIKLDDKKNIDKVVNLLIEELKKRSGEK